MTEPRTRLFLITPRLFDADEFASVLDGALAAGDVASLLIAPRDVRDDHLQDAAERLVPIAHRHGVAALIDNDTRITGRVKADGVHIDTAFDDLTGAIDRFHPNRIVGAGNLDTRHDAMTAAEAGADYVFFGRLDHDERAEPHRKDLDLGQWWAEMFEPPCVVMAGADPASIETVMTSGADFIAVRDAIWRNGDAAAAAIADANARIDAAVGASS